MSALLDSIGDVKGLKRLSTADLERLAAEIRHLIIEVVSRNGGHLASNLGVVELTIALHYCFDFLKDRLIWDVGHQCYTHKILTGRRDRFPSLRQKGGLSGFADSTESDYDPFRFGHTGASISAALGLSCGYWAADRDRQVVAVIGDGAIASGMPFEALNHTSELGRNLLVVLNDNEMSISRSVGAIARHLSKIRSSGAYTDARAELKALLEAFPPLGRRFDRLLSHLREGLHAALTPGGLFVELGFRYFGPADGHDIGGLVDVLRRVRRLPGPVLLHVITQKGRGFEPACKDPAAFHSSKRFVVEKGAIQVEESPGRTYSEEFGQALVEMAQQDGSIVAITAAMPAGTALTEFATCFPDRFYDVGICEQHALGFAGGLAAGGLKPVAAIYSTFLQRAHDQLFHDIALQGSPVLLCVDRAGLVGHDGPTHHGVYDIAFCRCFPGMVVMAPKDAAELRGMLKLALESGKPCVVRYPREQIPCEAAMSTSAGLDRGELAVGRAERCTSGPDGAIIAYGAMVVRALQAARILREDGINITVLNARFAKPLDDGEIVHCVRSHPAVLTAEDHALAGGFGAAVLELLASKGVNSSHVRLAAIPDQFIEQGPREELLRQLALDGTGLAERLRRNISDTGKPG